MYVSFCTGPCVSVIVHVCKHKKDPAHLPLIKKFFGFMMEWQSINHPGEQIVLMFDMTNAGLSNLVRIMLCIHYF